MNDDPRYPVGRFDRRDSLTTDERRAAIDTIAAAPARMREAVAGLSDEQLDTPYRDGGWSVRQVVHHVPDSHMNAFFRTKLALTEENPIIRPYDEAAWAELSDVRDTPVETSLTLLEALHARWTTLLRALDESDFARTLQHPEHKGPMTLDTLVGMYAWHSLHHVAHVTSLRERMNW
ncbi:MAG TPA: bacillithiol transferase BstA [Thermoanaerobaculia bacterium]|nr:bacillithiol transferase BstA [Thermoanaerobaculia bacterium]